MKLIDVFLTKNNSIKIENEEKIEEKYISKNFYYKGEDETKISSLMIFQFYILILYYIYIIYFTFVFIKFDDENDIDFMEFKNFYECNKLFFIFYHLCIEILVFYELPNIYQSSYLKNYIFEGNLAIIRKRINIIKFLFRVSPYYALINVILIIWIKLYHINYLFNPIN